MTLLSFRIAEDEGKTVFTIATDQKQGAMLSGLKVDSGAK